MVTERERRELAAIERALTAEDPGLDRRLRTLRAPVHPGCGRDLMILVPLLLMTAAVVLHLPAVSAACGLLAVCALVLHPRDHEPGGRRPA
ncbi:DUF3040 domain-containing protein [Pseudonocardia sp. RS11V-5]|uniref:DUF3040 domain-containing protein n=1 Tax=Pseudonocardia terrae TaxID=2905831 RepID=UPI001E4E06A3|nr:DUF3040 domain-containing protein [Pseudonocardia terrae]MCE3551482.1 DUF3040 domain-containing protein [Pseudonocardia terrae]